MLYFGGTPGQLCLYRLREVVYDENNKPVGTKFGDKLWTPQEADALVENMLGGVVTTAEERVQGLK